MVSENESRIPEKIALNPFAKEPPIIKAYTKRWYILIVYVMYTTLSLAQWVEYSIITNIVMRYYGVSASSADWTSMVFTIVWPIGVLPASFIIDKLGLRVAALLGCLLTAIGAAVKVFSFEQDRFYVVLIGQFLVANSQLFILNIPPKIAITWFKPKEVSTICSLAVFGIQLGTALGFLLPPIIVKNNDSMDKIRSDLKTLCWGFTAFTAPVALAVLVHFPDKPPHPPSLTQAEELENKEEVTMAVFFKSLKSLIKNKPFLVHVISYGISVGIFSVIGTLLNPIILNYFEGAQEDAGRMGLVMLLLGMVGSTVIGFILDKTHRYKESSFAIYLLSAISLGGVLLSLELRSKWMVYLSIGVFGFFLNSYIPTGIELATELTFPAAESTTTSILMASSQIFGLVFTLVLSQINISLGTFWTLVGQIGLLAVGALLTGITPNVLRRQEAFKKEMEIDEQTVQS